MCIRILTFVSALLLAVSAFPQRVKIYGTVRDADGRGVEFASVRVQGTGARTSASLQGEYTLYAERSDSVLVVCSQIGYGTRRRLLLSPADSVRLDFTLQTIDAQVGEAVVTGQAIQTTGTQRIQMADVQTMPSVTGNGVEEVIATQAGVSTHNELSSQYNVRGGSFDENVVYLDGLEVHRPMLVRSGQQEGLSIINPDMVDRIHFSTGGFEARYGDKMSSVLDITYKRPERSEGRVYASLLGAGAYFGTGSKAVSFMTSVRYKTTKYLLGTLDSNGEYSPSFIDVQAMLSLHPGKKWSLDLLGNLSDNNYTFKPADRETSFGTLEDAKTFKVYFDGKEKDRFRTYFGAATLTHHFTPESFLALQFSTYATQERETYDIQGEYWLNEATSQEQLGVGTYMEHARNRLKANVYNVGLRWRQRLRPNDSDNNHTLQAGFNWQSEKLTERSTEWEMRDSAGFSLPYDPQRLQLIYSLRAAEEVKLSRIEAFVQDTWRLNTGLGLFNFTYGVRLSRLDFNKETIVSPRLSIGLLPRKNENWALRFATGVYYQAPTYKELRDTTITAGVATVGLNRELKSQRSIHFVLGADYTFRMLNRPFKFTTEVYYKALSRLNPYSVDNLRIVYYGRNVASGYAAGIDFKLYGEFVPGTDSWITFSLMKTAEKINGVTLPRPTDQRYNLSLFFTDYFPGTTRWRAALKLAFAGGLPFGPPHSDRSTQTFRAPAYKRVDLGLSYRLVNNEDRHITRGFGRIIKNAWIGIDALNLLGISNVNSYYWVTDITNTQYAVPNYLTGRQINARFSIEF